MMNKHIALQLACLEAPAQLCFGDWPFEANTREEGPLICWLHSIAKLYYARLSVITWSRAWPGVVEQLSHDCYAAVRKLLDVLQCLCNTAVWYSLTGLQQANR